MSAEDKNWDDGQDDPEFNAQLYWSAVNGEECATMAYEKRRFEFDLKLIALIEKREVSLYDIMNHFQVGLEKARAHLQAIRRRGVVLGTRIDKGNNRKLYSVISKPEKLVLFVPRWHKNMSNKLT